MIERRSWEAIPLIQIPEGYLSRIGPFLAEMYERHGPIFRSDQNGHHVIFMAGPEANRFVLLSNRLKFSNYIGWTKIFGVEDAFGNGLLSMDGAEHDAHRKMMNPAFAITYMDRYLPIMQRIIRERIADWAVRGEVDVYEEARKITFDVAAEALAGLTPGPEVDQFRELYLAMLRLTPHANNWDEFYAEQARLKDELYRLLRPKIVERRQHPTDDVLGMLVQARDPEGNALNDEQLIAHTNILLVAGHETSTSMSAWLLSLLAQHPDYLRRVQEEQAALVPDGAAPTLDLIQRMKVLENGLMEAERLYPPVSYGPRGVVEEFDFHGYHVPAGAHVFYAIAASHLIPSVFAAPTRFDPDRFAPPREEQKKTPYALVGFGGGPRICIGINFAKVEIKAMIAEILRQFTLALAPDQDVELFGVISRPRHGVRMRVHEREPALAAIRGDGP
ncbi:MAG TPA: cytochrome P450 [Thermomicrobiales bacterium]|jgi:cytochrome P450